LPKSKRPHYESGVIKTEELETPQAPRRLVAKPEQKDAFSVWRNRRPERIPAEEAKPNECKRKEISSLRQPS
jgi:hypothetical protein